MKAPEPLPDSGGRLLGLVLVCKLNCELSDPVFLFLINVCLINLQKCYVFKLCLGGH